MNIRPRKRRQSSLAASTTTTTTSGTWANMDSLGFRDEDGKDELQWGRHARGTYTRSNYLDIARTMLYCLDVKDRQYHLKTYKNCFVGSEAVDFLQHYLHLSSREEALQVGQEMNSAIHCLEHVTHDHEDQLKDEYLFYRFTDFCIKRNFTLLEVMRAFQLGVPVEDRTYRLKTYPKVFVGSEAIDFLVKYKFAASRLEALSLGRRLEEEFDLFVHVTGEHVLKDDYMFYRMQTPKIGRSMEDQDAERKALMLWIYAFTLVAMAIYYFIF